MGFPNAGFKAALKNISQFKDKAPKHPPLFINIGKNRSTPLDLAHNDYVKGVSEFNELADAFVVNISSPNTKDLRLLHQKENFLNFIDPILNESLKQKVQKPLFIKLSPDLDDTDFVNFLKDTSEMPFAGYTLTNTTVSRPNGLKFPERGGLSGAPLKELSLKKLKLAKESLASLKSGKKVISVGGVMNPQDAVERIEAGADLVQFYSGLIFYGPSLFANSTQRLKKLRPQD